MASLALGCALLSPWLLAASASRAAPITLARLAEAPLSDAISPGSDPTPAGIPADWWDRIQADLTAREYEISIAEGTPQAPNRAHNLRAWFRADGVGIEPRLPMDSAWRLAWRTIGHGRGASLTPAESTRPTFSGARVEYARGRLEEWYENRRDGLEQGFTVHERPPGEGPLCIAGAFEGDLTTVSDGRGRSVALVDREGGAVLEYGRLFACDADGRPLAASFALDAPGIRILVDDRDARYPVRIDPRLGWTYWLLGLYDDTGAYGRSGATAGDVNGDGFSDVIVGAPETGSNNGRAYLYLGSATGPIRPACWIVDGEQGDLLGESVSSAGDVNRDGYDDVLIGVPGHSNGQDREGAVRLYLGGPDGLGGDPDWQYESDAALARFGCSVSLAGDVNGDSYGDVIIGAYTFSGGDTSEGKAYLFLGTNGGLQASPAWTHEGGQYRAWFGRCVAWAGDVNADGYDDVLIGAPGHEWDYEDEGWAYLYLGSASGLGGSAWWVASGGQEGAFLGWSVSTAGDVDGDGYADILIGVPYYDGEDWADGRTLLYAGGNSGPIGPPTWVFEPGGYCTLCGYAVAPAGDINGDGYADVIIGSLNNEQGRVDIFLGSWAGLAAVPDWTAYGESAAAEFGAFVSTAGDITGDGFSDFMVGEPGVYFEDGQGVVQLYRGAGGTLRESPGWVLESNQTGARAAKVAFAGDVNGDGYDDLLVGARSYDNGQADEGMAFLFTGGPQGPAIYPAWYAESNQAGAEFGADVAGAGDVNGDGCADVLIGARSHDGAQSDEGWAFLWFGSPAAIPPGNPTNADWSAHGSASDESFGYAVSSAGDVNGDGYGDIAIGAYGYGNGQTGEGAAFVYAGSADGLSAAPCWSYEPDQAGARFGCDLACAGNVNGDLFCDLLVGAERYDDGQLDEGAAFLFYGSWDGPSPSPDWSAEGNQTDARFGFAVSGGGDVDGDGYSDILIGAPRYDGDGEDAGGVFCLRGGLGGPTAHFELIGDQAGAQLGYSIACAGDIDGDGRSDLAAGAPFEDGTLVDEGCVRVLHGGAYGFDWSWTHAGAQAGASFGSFVAGPGDVNGDGFSDLFVGAPGYSGGQTDEGRVYLFYGNDSRGLARIPQQERTDHSAPISVLGISNAETAVGLRALGRTPAGRGRVWLEWEVHGYVDGFDGEDIHAGSLHDTGAPSGNPGSAVLLQQTSNGMATGWPYCWRVRIASRSPIFPRSPWLTLSANARTEMDLRMAGSTAAAPDLAPPARPVQLEIAPTLLSRGGRIRFVLPMAGRLELSIHDLEGRRVVTLFEGALAAGEHLHLWDGRDARGRPLHAGVYLARLECAGSSVSVRFVLTR